MKKKLIVFSFVAVMLAGLVVPSFAGSASAAVPAAPVATSAQSHAAFLDKTRFLLHMGYAYFAFHHWVWKPYKAGAFNKGASGRVKAIVKAAIALAFTYHELKVAYNIAKKSHSGLLHAIIAPLTGLMNKANSVVSQLKGGNVNVGDLAGLGAAADGLGKLASGKGLGITDQMPMIPGL